MFSNFNQAIYKRLLIPRNTDAAVSTLLLKKKAMEIAKKKWTFVVSMLLKAGLSVEKMLQCVIHSKWFLVKVMNILINVHRTDLLIIWIDSASTKHNLGTLVDWQECNSFNGIPLQDIFRLKINRDQGTNKTSKDSLNWTQREC